MWVFPLPVFICAVCTILSVVKAYERKYNSSLFTNPIQSNVLKFIWSLFSFICFLPWTQLKQLYSIIHKKKKQTAIFRQARYSHWTGKSIGAKSVVFISLTSQKVDFKNQKTDLFIHTFSKVTQKSLRLIITHLDNTRPHSRLETICCDKSLFFLPCGYSSGRCWWASQGQGRFSQGWLPCNRMKIAFIVSWWFTVYTLQILALPLDPDCCKWDCFEQT